MGESIAVALRSSFINCVDGAAEFCIAPDFPAFDGHFPNMPLLAGVIQAELCLVSAEKLFGKTLHLQQIGKAKFSKPVLPGAKLSVMAVANGEQYAFSISDQTGAVTAKIQLTARDA